MSKPAPVLALAALLASAVARAQAPPPSVEPPRSEACREADATLGKAKELLARKEVEGALEAVEAAKRGCPAPTAEYFLVHGDALAGLKRWNDAVMQYHEALRMKPDFAEAANALARVFYLSRRYEQAKAVLRNAESAGATVDPDLKKAVEEKLAKPK
jgi:tetratricopeptide (TPR) repeat protein